MKIKSRFTVNTDPLNYAVECLPLVSFLGIVVYMFMNDFPLLNISLFYMQTDLIVVLLCLTLRAEGS